MLKWYAVIVTNNKN